MRWAEPCRMKMRKARPTNGTVTTSAVCFSLQTSESNQWGALHDKTL